MGKTGATVNSGLGVVQKEKGGKGGEGRTGVEEKEYV